jgi:hypothetical protein
VKGQLPIHVKNVFAKKSQRRNGTGQIKVSRPMQVRRNMSNKIYNVKKDICKMKIKIG